MYETVVVSTVVMHFAFIAYVLAGGFLALRWRRTMWLRRAGRRHKKLVETFLNAASRADKSAAYHALSRTATMTLGEDELLDIVELFEQLRGASWTKVTGAGSTVAVSLASDHRRGIMFADVPWRGNRINRIRYFPA